MTKKEFKEKAERIYKSYGVLSQKEASSEIYDLMIWCLSDLGYEEGVSFIKKAIDIFWL